MSAGAAGKGCTGVVDKGAGQGGLPEKRGVCIYVHECVRACVRARARACVCMCSVMSSVCGHKVSLYINSICSIYSMLCELSVCPLSCTTPG